MLGRPLKYHIATAVALALFASSPAWAQLDQRLAEAEQKLDSDTRNCTPINLGDYATLLREAAENKQRADKAARRGVPIDQAKVDADLANAQSLFNRANAALIQQCIRNATRPQTQPQATPQTQTTGTVPATQPAPAQGLSESDQRGIAQQQRTIDDFEEALAELQSLIKGGKCEAAWDLVDELDEWLDELDRPSPLIRPAGLGPGPRIPGRLIDQWDERIDQILDGCPRPGRPRIKLDVSAILGLHNSERAKYGYEPLRWSLRLADNAQIYADQLAQTGQLAHASREGRGIERENISSGLPGWSTNQLLDSWFNERTYFTPGTFPNISSTGNWADAGHYSQAIWPTTTSIGCGISYGSGFSWLVCRYSPGGNKDGKPVGQPLQTPQVASAPNGPSSIRPRLIGGDYSGRAGQTDQGQAQSAETGGRRASLFDLGIYAGGAWTTDWFELEDTLPDPILSIRPSSRPLYFLSTGSFGETCTVPPVTDLGYLDLALSFRVGDHYSFRLGVNNLLDRDPPPVSGPGGPAGSSASTAQIYDALGRYIFAGCTLDF